MPATWEERVPFVVARKLVLSYQMYPLTSPHTRNLTNFAPGEEGGRIPDFIITKDGILYFSTGNNLHC